MRAKGMSQIEIAHKLQVSEASISSDMQYLRNQAKEFIKEYVTEHLPEHTRYVLQHLMPLSSVHLRYVSRSIARR
jgi:hypothetical protein